MSNITLDDLQEASFRGIPFLYRRATKTFGRKTQPHEYPGQKERFVEDLGELDDAFDITAVITGPDYFAKRDALERALRTKGPGQLVHPLYGPVTVSVIDVSVDEDLVRMNEVTYRLSFLKTLSEPIFPAAVIATQPAILESVERVSSGTAIWIADTFSVSRAFPRNFQDAAELLNGYSDTLAETVDGIAVLDDISQFSTDVMSFRDSINNLITDTTQLGLQAVQLFTEMQSLVLDPKIQLGFNQSFFDFGDSDTPIVEKTTERTERADNRSVINTAAKSLALANGYEAAANIEYFDTVELEETRSSLENQYQEVREAAELSPDVLEELQSMRTVMRDFFVQQEISAYRISEVETNQVPMTVLAYQYYGDTDLTENLITLNETKYSPAVEGTTKLYAR